MAGEGTRFKKGNKFSKGRPPLPPEVREARKFTQTALEAKLVQFLKMTKYELEKIMADSKAPMIDLMLSRIIVRSLKDGDHYRLDFILNRLLGKVKDKIEHSLPEPIYIEKPNGDTILLGSKISGEEDGAEDQ